VAVKGGGNLVTHRPVFSQDGSTLFVIQSCKVLSYSTATGLLISKYTTPGASSIANIHVQSPESTLVFTTTGQLLTVNLSSNTVSNTRQINLCPTGWTPIGLFTNFLHPAEPDSSHFLAVGYPQDSALPVLYSISTDELIISKLCWSILPSQHSVAMSPSGRFVVAIQETSLYCKDMNEPKNCKWHSSGTRKFTCVAVHPTTEWCCATGDDSGRILIWNNVMGTSSPEKTVFHWHTLPVADLAFTPEGSQMLSGGGECTMVKWDVSDTTNKRTLPRMGLPIRHVSVCENGEFVGVSHADNCIQLVDPYNKIVGAVKNITQAYVAEAGEEQESDEKSNKVFQAGIQVDPNNGLLVLNGRPGWLQCYDFVNDKHVYALDVCQQNYVTAERHKIVPNAEVTHVAFSKNGLWMGVAESRMEGEGTGKCSEIKLKFWKFDKVKQMFILNTCVDWPHETPLSTLKMQPIPEQDGMLAASSSTRDSKFKFWSLVSDPSIHGKSEWWVCEKAPTYKDEPSGPLAFSTDGSILAASFGKILTLWDTDSLDFRLSLCHQRLTESIKAIEFGQNVSSHLILCLTTSNLVVWDVITSSLLWVAPVSLDCICVDPLSNLVAGISGSTNHLYFFSPDSPSPLAVHKNVSKSKVLSMAFVPNHKQMESVGMKSTVLFVNSSQELCAVLPKQYIDQEDGDILRVSSTDAENSGLTPYAQMVAEKTVSLVESTDKWGSNKTGSSGMKAYSILRDIMDASPHTMPSATYYCSQLLKTLSKPTSDQYRLAQMEKLVMSSTSFSKRQTRVDEEPDSFSANSVADSKENNLQTVSFSTTLLHNVDLDSVANENTSWIDKIFTK
ncbi:WD repeat-containing protein 75, partial [Orchesella cincta]